MLSQRRPVEGADTPDGQLSWSPQLDLRNCGVAMVRTAVTLMDTEVWAPWFADYLRLAALDHADLGKAAATFCAAVGAWLADPASEPDAHLVAGGFYAEPLPCQQAIFAVVGRVALGHFAHAMRHATMPADAPDLPYRAALERLHAEGARIAESLAWSPATPVARLGCGLALLRPFAAGTADRLLSGGVGVDCNRAVPAAVEARLTALGWYYDYNSEFPCWKFPL